MNPGTIIFDMDGVILDSERVYQSIEREMYHELGISVSKEEHGEFKGTSERSMWKQLHAIHGFSADPENLVIQERERFLQKLRSPEKIPPIEGIYELLEYIKGKGIPIYIASSSSREIIETVVEVLDISGYFDGIVSGDDVEQSKPAPDIFLKASNLAGVEPEFCIVIEDSVNGVNAARAAGMKVVGLACPGTDEAGLAEADRIIRNLKEFDPGMFH